MFLNVCRVGRSGLGIKVISLWYLKLVKWLRSLEWALIEEQPEDQALCLSSVMGSVEQEVPKRRLRSERWGLGMGVAW